MGAHETASPMLAINEHSFQSVSTDILEFFRYSMARHHRATLHCFHSCSSPHEFPRLANCADHNYLEVVGEVWTISWQICHAMLAVIVEISHLEHRTSKCSMDSICRNTAAKVVLAALGVINPDPTPLLTQATERPASSHL